MLRDEPFGSEIPEFKASDYNATKLAEAEKALAEFLAMSEQERRELHAAEHAKNIQSAERGIAEKASQQQRYESMLAKAETFKSPSVEHSGVMAAVGVWKPGRLPLMATSVKSVKRDRDDGRKLRAAIVLITER